MTKEVSIHARVERATFQWRLALDVFNGFNPRTRRACDKTLFRWSATKSSFNPRTRRACDGRFPPSPGWRFSFNPRTRRACDLDRGLVNGI